MDERKALLMSSTFYKLLIGAVEVHKHRAGRIHLLLPSYNSYLFLAKCPAVLLKYTLHSFIPTTANIIVLLLSPLSPLQMDAKSAFLLGTTANRDVIIMIIMHVKNSMILGQL
jgi:hypothetical protein